MFNSIETDKLTTKDLLEGLVDIDDAPWALMFEDDLKRDRLQTAAARLSRLLRDYKRPDGHKIKPHPIRLSAEIVKGFYRSDFEEAWKRYVKPSLPACANVVTSVTSVTYDVDDLTRDSPGVGSETVNNRLSDSEATVSVFETASVTDVTAVTPF